MRAIVDGLLFLGDILLILIHLLCLTNDVFFFGLSPPSRLFGQYDNLVVVIVNNLDVCMIKFGEELLSSAYDNS